TIIAAAFAQAQTSGNAIEVHDLARIDPVRIADLFTIHVPHLWPAPWTLQEFSRNVPQGIAAHHHMLIGSIWQKRATRLAGYHRLWGFSKAADRQYERGECEEKCSCAKIFHGLSGELD